MEAIIYLLKRAVAALLGLAIVVGLSACATGLPTRVTRYSAAAIPAGQSFYVVPASGDQPTLEFNHFAALVAKQMEARGFKRADASQVADLLIKVSYGVDEGTRKYVADPFARSRFYDPFYRGTYWGRPYWSRFGYYGYRSPYYWGWDDPFWYGYGLRGPVYEYTVYMSFLDFNIVRRQDGLPLFEGHAKARSQTDELGTLIPNLIEAMFTDFPGKSGETVKITIPAKKQT